MAYEEHGAPSDEALMEAASRGDDRAFAALVRRWEGPLFGYLRRLLGNAADAEEVFQETFLRVFRHRDRFHAGAAFRPWLYSIATNVARDRLRQRQRRPMESLDPPAAAAVANGKPGPAARAETREFEERLRTAVNALPDKQRSVFLLARYEGMKYEDISQTLDVPVGTVKSRMNKAVHFLTDRLREYLP